MSASNIFNNIGHLDATDFDTKGNLTLKEAKNLPVFCMVQSSYCGHCIKSKPAFKELFDTYHGKGIFCATLQTDEPRQEVKELMKNFSSILKRHNIAFNGVPSYLLFKDGKVYEYQGGRDFQSLSGFVKEIIQ